MFSKLKDYYNTKKTTTGAIKYIIVGLGNPGKEYANTRHNAGFLALDYISAKSGIPTKKLKFNSFCGDGSIGGERVLLMKPDTFMNKSGEAVILAVNYYDIPVENVIILCDDITLPLGKLRIRRKGSHGGQNGLKNIIALLHSDEFPRIRMGIDPKPHPDMDLADWVLHKLSPGDQKALENTFPSIYNAVELILKNDINGAMNLVN